LMVVGRVEMKGGEGRMVMVVLYEE
jgi:hypothetical protein